MIVICIPVLHRPHRVQPLIDSIERATPEPHRSLFVATEGDDTQQQAVEDAGGDLIVLPGEHRSGDYARKVNYAYRASWEPLLFLGADDLHFHSGWFEKAYEKLEPGIGVVGTNDLCNRRTRREHSTHSLVTRDYVDKFGTIDERHKVLHEGYPHEFVDDELVQTAVHRGAYVHADDCIVEHLHPMNGKAPTDALYEQQAARMKVGRRIFEARQHLWT